MKVLSPHPKPKEEFCAPPNEENQTELKLKLVLFQPHFHVSQLFLNCQRKILGLLEAGR